MTLKQVLDKEIEIYNELVEQGDESEIYHRRAVIFFLRELEELTDLFNDDLK